MPIRLSGLASGLDTEAIVAELMSAHRMKQTKVENKQTTLTWKQDKWKELNTKLYSFYTKFASKMRLEGSYNIRKVTSSDESIVKATATGSAPKGAHTLTVNQLASAQYVTSGKVKHAADGEETKLNTGSKLVSSLGMTAGTTISIKAGDKEAVDFEVTDTSSISDFVEACRKAGINASFDTTQQRFFLSSKESGAANAFTLTAKMAVNTDELPEDADETNASGAEWNADDELAKLGLGQIGEDAKEVKEGDAVAGSRKSAFSMTLAKDAEIVLDGATLTASSNNMTVNGLTLDLVSADKDKQIRLTVENDVDAVYNMIKDFVKEYNSILKEMNELYYADRAKGYEPLTDEQKEAMTDDEVEKWEKKIKDSLLRRDSTIGGITSSMRTIMMGQVKVNGKNYSLSSFGIMTSSDYTERGLLHIYGDTDDDTYADQEDKLRKAIEEDPESVVEVFTALGKNLYEDLTERMGKTKLSSAMTFYNDVEIKNQLNDYKKQLKDWEKKLQDMEDRYYKQFTAMEKAMADLNSSSNYLAGMLGTS